MTDYDRAIIIIARLFLPHSETQRKYILSCCSLICVIYYFV